MTEQIFRCEDCSHIGLHEREVELEGQGGRSMGEMEVVKEIVREEGGESSASESESEGEVHSLMSDSDLEEVDGGGEDEED